MHYSYKLFDEYNKIILEVFLMGKNEYMTTRRKLAISSWSSPKEGNIYGKLNVNATKTLEYIEEARAKGMKVTITHIVGKAMAETLKMAPSLNGRIVRGKFVPHDSIDIAFLISLEEGSDLAKAKIFNVDQKSIHQISEELREIAEKLRKGKDKDFEKSKDVLRTMPTGVIRPTLKITGYLANALGWNMKNFGMERFSFGSCIITSLGMFGIDEGYAPPTPFARVPLYVLVGSVRPLPVVIDGELAIQETLTLTATIDHRFIDGHQLSVLSKMMRSIIENPWQLD